MHLPLLIAVWRQKHWLRCTKNEKSSCAEDFPLPKNTLNRSSSQNGYINEFTKGFKQSLSMVGVRFFGMDLKTEPTQR
jgi:hypothetical protein